MLNAIEIRDLTKTYGTRRGLTGLTLDVRQGEVFGYLGPNGAGKSTTIRVLLDLIRPTGGSVRVLGLDPRHDGRELRRRIGYLAGDFVVDGRQSVRECLRFLARLSGGVPVSRIDELADRLGLDQTATIKNLSKGNRQKVGLVQAFMHTPELLILDEPTSGLDPLLQQTFLDLVTEAARNGQTVFMSSHIMDEVEAVADRIAILRDGRLVALDTVADLRAAAVRRIEIGFAAPVSLDQFRGLAGLTEPTLDDTGTILRARLTGTPDAVLKIAAQHTVTSLHTTDPHLDEIFHTQYADAAPRDAA
ncbi:ATP-binding cassette domain-containing protein [Nocardia sp. ET3-3]|uniref:ATP-binding cassette domain-containing protein n=1 Tax=Nocardia terrae TaxID=2675851 RepID=A0A7K1V1J8_9NOCA|nr:ATP-binding cassette domain-containing protein [Nocardia terrae]